MPIVTGKLSLRSNSANKTVAGVLTAVRNFLTNSGNYTVISDQIAGSSYFVVQSTRNTGFTGDRIIAQVIGFNAGGLANTSNPAIGIFPWESWSGTTGTNAGIVRSSTTVQTNYLHDDYCQFSLTIDSDIWISCDNTFILATSQVFNGTSLPVAGVACIERLTGDSDPGTFYGRVGPQLYDGDRKFYIPKRFDNTTGTNAWFNAATKVGSTTYNTYICSYGPDESDRHLIFDIGVSLASSSKMKGKIFGFNLTTYGSDFAQGCLLPNASSPQYMVGKSSNVDSYMNTLMQVSSTMTTITT